MDSSVLVTIVVNADCKIIAPDVSLGGARLASQFAAVSNTVPTDCTKGSTYKVAVTRGSASNARPRAT
jgi:spore coat protein U-like protein